MSVAEEDKFDEMLKNTLQRCSWAAPDDFADRMLRQVREAEARRILAKVILQKRLAMMCCVISSVVVVVAAIAFPGIAGNLTEQSKVFIGVVVRTVEIISSQWRFYTIFVGMLGFVIYSFVDFICGR